MKLVCKQGSYVPNGNKGVFPGAFLKDTKKSVDGEEYLKVQFNLYYVVDGKEIRTNYKTSIEFDTTHVPTYVVTGEEEEITGEKIPQRTEVLEYITNGGSLDDALYIEYGKPSAKNTVQFFDTDTLRGNLELLDTPLIEVVKGLLINTIYLDGQRIGANFEFE